MRTGPVPGEGGELPPVGQSEPVVELYAATTSLVPTDLNELAAVAARTPLPLLILGESGSGKSHLARQVHELSSRARGPFVRISCACIPEGLFEREMFGHVRGAFTDAKESREGMFEAASGGTLFLDELGEMPLTMQSKLLTVLEEGYVRRLGSPREIPVDVRIITATNCDLRHMVQQHRFREDLYFRCAVLEFRTPPLRERRHEIPSLVRSLLERAMRRLGSVPTISPSAMHLLCTYSWPGNIRELENALLQAVAFTNGNLIEVEHLPSRLHQALLNTTSAGSVDDRNYRYAAPPDEAEEVKTIRAALRAEGGNRTRAARRLGMSRSTLWAKLRFYAGQLG